jgi:hypothetical protein
MKTIAILACVVGAVLAGRHLWQSRPLPALEFKDAAANVVTFDQMLADKPRTVLVFLLPGCPMSRASMEIAKAAYAEHSDNVAFVGILMTGDAAAADQFRKQHDLPFPVYAIQSATDIFAANDLMNRIGTWRGVYGGTLVLTDARRRPIFLGRLEETRQLPEVLRKQKI